MSDTPQDPTPDPVPTPPDPQPAEVLEPATSEKSIEEIHREAIFGGQQEEKENDNNEE